MFEYDMDIHASSLINKFIIEYNIILELVEWQTQSEVIFGIILLYYNNNELTKDFLW